MDTSSEHEISTKRVAGVHRIATHLRKNGYDIEVVDFLPIWSVEELKQFTKTRVNKKTKFIGIGGTFNINLANVIEYCYWIKETYPDIDILAGSQVLTAIMYVPADYHFIGYGEKAITSYLDGKIKSKQIEIECLINEGKTVKINLVDSMYEYPAYPMGDLEIEYEERDFLQPSEILSMECSRGCIFKCKFCSYPILGVRDDHTREESNFVLNLKSNYDKWGITRYNIVDETFNDYSAKIIKYADMVEMLDFQPEFLGYIRADLLAARPEDMEHLSRMGMSSHYYGIESFHAPSAKAIGKGGNPDKIKETLLEAKKYFLKNNNFYKATIALIVGLPHETQETFSSTIEWIKRYWKNEALLVNPLIIPKKQDYSWKGSLLSQDKEKYGYVDGTFDITESLKNTYRNMLNTPDVWEVSKTLIEKRVSFMENRTSKMLTVPWVNNTGMSWQDAWELTIKYFYADDLFKDSGPEPWNHHEFLNCGYEYSDLMMSYRELGCVTPSVEKKIKFIDEYKKQKLSY